MSLETTVRRAKPVARWVRVWIAHPRLSLALKSALAVSIAWFIAHFMPGVTDEYPYYAPVGALVSMYPTLMSSVRNGIQTLAGLVTGMLLAGAVILLAEPNLVTVGLVVGVGVLLAGNTRFGAGREYIPLTALFVLIIGGQNADAYSIGYLAQMVVGVAVGLAVNFLIVPPLATDAAEEKLAEFRLILARHLDDIGTALTEHWPPETVQWSRQSSALIDTAAAVREAIRLSTDSRKGNPRARRHPRDTALDEDDLQKIETITFHIRDLTDVLVGAVWGSPLQLTLEPAICPPLSDAMHAVAEVLKSSATDRDRSARLTRANEAIVTLTTNVWDGARDHNQELGAAVVATMDLKRILTALEPTREPV